jgi:hypothetical protein
VSGYRGATSRLTRKGDPKRPLVLFVYDDALIIVEPPEGSPTTSLNQSAHVRVMTYILATFQAMAQSGASSEALLTALRAVTDPDDIPPGVQRVRTADIVAARVSKGRLTVWWATLEISGGEELVFAGGKKAITEFAGLLAAPLGARLTQPG